MISQTMVLREVANYYILHARVQVGELTIEFWPEDAEEVSVNITRVTEDTHESKVTTESMCFPLTKKQCSDLSTLFAYLSAGLKGGK